MEIQNANPKVYEKLQLRTVTAEEEDDDVHDLIDSREIFDILFINSTKQNIRLYCNIHFWNFDL